MRFLTAKRRRRPARPALLVLALLLMGALYAAVAPAARVSADNGNSQQVAEGENTPLPANPTREGYDFDAWIDQNGNGWGDSASKPVTGDATYTATWRAHDAVDGTADTLESGVFVLVVRHK